MVDGIQWLGSSSDTMVERWDTMVERIVPLMQWLRDGIQWLGSSSAVTVDELRQSGKFRQEIDISIVNPYRSPRTNMSLNMKEVHILMFNPNFLFISGQSGTYRRYALRLLTKLYTRTYRFEDCTGTDETQNDQERYQVLGCTNERFSLGIWLNWVHGWIGYMVGRCVLASVLL